MPITVMHKSAYQVVLQVRGEPSDYLQPLRSALREFDPTASAWS